MPLDPRLEKHRPALRYDPQEAYRAMSAASITDNPGNTLVRFDGAIVARAGHGLSLAYLETYPVETGDRLDETNDPLSASRRFQAAPAYADRVYGRVKEDGGRTWLQYWLWCYYNPKHLLGLGKHEGDWEVVQVGLGASGEPEAVTYSQHSAGEGRDAADTEWLDDVHPMVYVAPLSHACYFKPGAHPYVLGVDTPSGSQPPLLPTVEELGNWAGWSGRWGNSKGVGGGKYGGRSPASPARQGDKWSAPGKWHLKAAGRKSQRAVSRASRRAGELTYPRLTALAAHREGDAVAVDWILDPAPARAATHLLVTVHRAEAPDEVLVSHAARISGRQGTVTIPVPDGLEDAGLVRASAYNALRQRSDPLTARLDA